MKSAVEKLRQKIACLAEPADLAQQPEVITTGNAVIDAHLPEGGLTTGKVHEFVPADYGASTAVLGFGLGLLHQVAAAKTGPLIFCTLGHDPNRRGALFTPGLSTFGLDPARLIHVEVPSERDLLWVMEESLNNSQPAAVVTHLPAQERLYGFTASQRLALRAAQTGTTAFFIRQHGGQSQTTASHTRWAVSCEPSRPVSFPGRANYGLGQTRFGLTLTKCKNGRPRSWVVEWDHETFSLNLASPLADRAPLSGRAVGNGEDLATRAGAGGPTRFADHRHQSAGGQSRRQLQPLAG